MADLEHRPVAHDHVAFLEKALKRKGFSEAYDSLEDEYLLVRELLTARARASSRKRTWPHRWARPRVRSQGSKRHHTLRR